LLKTVFVAYQTTCKFKGWISCGFWDVDLCFVNDWFKK